MIKEGCENKPVFSFYILICQEKLIKKTHKKSKLTRESHYENVFSNKYLVKLATMDAKIQLAHSSIHASVFNHVFWF